jgi:hypothetical protein
MGRLPYSLKKIMNLSDFIHQLKTSPETINFQDCISSINKNYQFTPTAFNNGPIQNKCGQNEGSCKIFAFGLKNNLSEQQTLACFGDYYRVEVLQNPDADNHQNIRQFMSTGWSGIHFDKYPLS